ncbi:pleckstrin homology domain-containing family G member 3-like [Diaphorina citri]|uniref:Pleckstrin homology domain-containing family G member 3-like n=1 Tax=Diaphorina citri TaxID=121845 RepID=A0A3Q0JFC2_DIACI|nr:pleckstrin homology domain-containing family G member 3-like [Diaphorina citri]
MSVLTELMRQENAAKLFRERQIALAHTLPLGSYLLKPVQRILKYHLLLQNIVKQVSLSRKLVYACHSRSGRQTVWTCVVGKA